MLIIFGVNACGLSLASGLTLDEYMKKVKSENKIFKSLMYSTEAANEKLAASDILFIPVLTAAGSVAVDKSLPSALGDRRQVTEYSLGVAKKFSTGTSLTLSAKTDQYKNDTTIPNQDQFSTGGLGISLQQSLWKDFLGEATELRRSRELILNQLDTINVDLRLRGALYDAEATFWDYALAQEDLKLKKSNFERAKKLENWTGSRVTNGISDRADLMNVKALAAIREVQLITAEDEIKTQETKFREYLVVPEGDPTPPITADLNSGRNFFTELMKKKDVVKIDSYLQSLDAKTKKIIAEEFKETLRPDLALVGSYNSTIYDRDYDQVTKNMASTDRPRTFVGVNFSWMFDGDAKSAQISAFNKEALASQYLAERSMVLGRNAWSDLLRKYEITKANVITLSKVANFQRERARAEQERLSKGRTITSNVVTAETDAAEAEVTLLKAQSGLRKLEASSILFIAL